MKHCDPATFLQSETCLLHHSDARGSLLFFLDIVKITVSGKYYSGNV